MRATVLVIYSLLFFSSCRTGSRDVSELTGSATKTLMQCAVGKVSALNGYRINVTENSSGELAINFLEGTSVSGTKYKATKVSGKAGELPGEYEGSRGAFKATLIVSDKKISNRYIEGFDSKLEITFEDVREPSGEKVYISERGDQFVCGKKIGNFGS